MSNPYQITFKLKQHTPIIHFQHDQTGATLRATEVKPKLDKFLIRYFKAEETNYHNWLIKGKEDSLDYKIRIVADSLILNKDIYSLKHDKWHPDFPCVFGNIKDQDKCKYLIKHDSVCLTIFCHHSELMNHIKDNIENYFDLHTFGYRQSKGFGSFTIMNRSANNNAMPRYHFAVDVSRQPDEYAKQRQLFRQIDLFYRTLRSGINQKRKDSNGQMQDVYYFKSLMFMYAKTKKQQQWDKRTIREHFYLNHNHYISIKENRDDPNGTVQYDRGTKENNLFRDLLGLSTDQDWRGYGPARYDQRGRTQYKTDSITKKSRSGEIVRFKSPMVFKPVRRTDRDIYDVFIIQNQIPDKYLGHVFTVKSKTSSSRPLDMTIFNSFDLNEFMEFCCKEVFPDDRTFRQHVNNSNHPDIISLRSMFSDLRNC